MSKLTYQPPSLGVLGSLDELTLETSSGFGLDLFACVSGQLQATLTTSSSRLISIDAIVLIPDGSCNVKGIAS